ncbi:cell division ATP-binding protein FtsE [Sphingomonas nostoxanthinifaciens]|uniref:cell division ATP-binding protein FtsE n=1 Tax=Sphingomonas nostoxanthinifaciens TaxID=2872652 RepID=UPI001CC1C2C0|nr:ATP-binding cassette domain-containing protein [Sphingomonas nostoxanthinifaciens]UAK22959.1 ATP-binding cassette domain-containing protein [Sphingomonas nostoxanthinifaciens]
MAGIVQIENVGLRFGTGAEALSDLSLTLARGSFHFLVGPSGAGKTSLLRLIGGGVRPSRGIVRLFGEDLAGVPRARLPALRRRLGMVHQDAVLVPGLTSFDNIALPLRIAGLDEAQISAQVSEMLDWVGLATRAAARPEALSAGERQRVGIARAVIGRPELILADEPTGNVDAELAARLIHLLDALHRAGTTVVVATHDLSLIGRVRDAGLIRLARGRLDDPVGTLRHPAARLATA